MKKYPEINEGFICKIWEGGSKYYSGIRTSSGEEVYIIDFGKRNFDSGPDYLGAKVRISGNVYNGDIEIHRDFGSWVLHRHKGDRNYNSVILQVVLWDRGENYIPRVKGKRLVPTVVLSKFLTQSIHNIWQELINNPELKFKLPCSDYQDLIPGETLNGLLNKLSLERLNLKSRRIKARLQELIFKDTGELNYNLFLRKSNFWKQVFYEFVFEALGFSKNKEPMLKLSRGLRLDKIFKTLQGHQNDRIFAIQAILFGSAGFLNEIKIKSGYPFEIKKLWLTLSHDKVKTNFLDKSDWKFFRLRPHNFPTIRIAYGSQIIYRILYEEMFKNVIKIFLNQDIGLKEIEKDLKILFEPEDDEFWNHNYKFGGISNKKLKLIGRDRINDIISNVIIPFVYLYSQVFNEETAKLNILKFYTSHKISSSNSIVKIIDGQLLKNKGVSINTPAKEQSIIHLYNFYCSRGKCDECKIGMNFVKEKGYEYRIIFY